MDILEVNGPNADPLYKYLREQLPASVPRNSRTPAGSNAIEWNYVKFLVDRQGVPVKRFGPSFDPLEFEGDVRLLLAGKPPTPAECVSHPGRKVCNVDRLLEQQPLLEGRPLALVCSCTARGSRSGLGFTCWCPEGHVFFSPF
eukprot:TRINITY_DN25809_c0_g1_i1.p1 TRINITY_DN25809_c0_g1~~TRINITY_DN25809_c0_g1_i1.p1  ORF type:complete len:143 (+),score=13.99 TRINITY_DN25809_c0_g1_i1:362-790(+)